MLIWDSEEIIKNLAIIEFNVRNEGEMLMLFSFKMCFPHILLDALLIRCNVGFIYFLQNTDFADTKAAKNCLLSTHVVEIHVISQKILYKKISLLSRFRIDIQF